MYDQKCRYSTLNVALVNSSVLSELQGTHVFLWFHSLMALSSTLGLCGPLISETVLCFLAGTLGDFLLIGEHAMNLNCTLYSSVEYHLDEKCTANGADTASCG